MSKFSVITSLNQKYYDEVGYKMVESFLEFWPSDINLRIYSEEKIVLQFQSERVQVIDLLEAQPSLNEFIQRAKKRSDAKLLKSSLKKGAIRFSYKSFAIIDGALNNSGNFIIWHDADMITHKKVSHFFLDSLVADNIYSVYLGRENTYTETGFLIFNTKKSVNKDFMNSWKKIYENDEIYSLDEWHDCKCYDKLRLEFNTKDNNLSPWGKDYEHVLINSILGEYFDHLKGERKKEGTSNATDILLNRTEAYWQEIQNSLITIVSVSDESYLQHLKTLIISAFKHSKNISFEVLLVNIKNKQSTEKELRSLTEFINISYSDHQFSNLSQKQSFCANARVNFINKLLNRNVNKILYLDADSLIRKDLQKYDWSFNNTDIQILFRESEQEEKFKFATGVIAIKNSPSSQEFFKAWDESINSLIFDWFSDQITFYRTYLKFKNKLNFKDLSSSMIDWEFNEESTIWVGKGNRKYRSPIYRLESFKHKLSSSRATHIVGFIQGALQKLKQLFIKFSKE